MSAPTFADGLRIGHEIGYVAGLDAAGRAVGNAIAQACVGIPDDAATVIRRLVSTWDRAERRVAAVATEAREGDFPGGMPLPGEYVAMTLASYRHWCAVMVAERLDRDPMADRTDYDVAVALGVGEPLVRSVRRAAHREAA